MKQKALNFLKHCNNESTFDKSKRPISIDEVDVRRTGLSEKDLFGKKSSFTCFVEYLSETNAFPTPLE